MIKLNIPYSELMARAQKLIGDRGKVISIAPTMGGRIYLVAFKGIRRYSWDAEVQGAKFTVWEIVDAQEFYQQPKSFHGQQESIPRVNYLIQELDALGLTKMPSTLRELKQAFRKVAKQHHPDCGGNAEMFRFVEGAYRRLCLRFEELQLV